ncbi:MAG: DUF4382 domain-containing protein [Fluviicola sp.]
MKILKKAFVPTAFALMCGFAMTSCEKEVDANNQNNQPEGNSFEMRMTDAPGDYESLDVEIASVAVYSQSAGWVTLNNQAQMVSILELNNGAETQIGFNSNVAAGTYTQARITFGTNNSLKLNSSSNAGLILPTGASANGTLNLALDANLGQERTVYININEEVSAQSGASLLLDFNAAASIEENANEWIMDPVITVVTNETTGLEGDIQGAQQASIRFVNNSTNAESSTYMAASGDFMVRNLSEGSYTVYVDAEVEGQTENETMVINNVTVVEGEISSMGTINVQ